MSEIIYSNPGHGSNGKANGGNVKSRDDKAQDEEEREGDREDFAIKLMYFNLHTQLDMCQMPDSQ